MSIKSKILLKKLHLFYHRIKSTLSGHRKIYKKIGDIEGYISQLQNMQNDVLEVHNKMDTLKRMEKYFNDAFNRLEENVNKYIKEEHKDRISYCKKLRNEINISIMDATDGLINKNELIEMIKKTNASLAGLTFNIDSKLKTLNDLEELATSKIIQFDKMKDDYDKIEYLSLEAKKQYNKFIKKLRDEIYAEIEQHKFMNRITSLETRITLVEISNKDQNAGLMNNA